jgi:NitT/TauT family transport system ATP-binding protein
MLHCIVMRSAAPRSWDALRITLGWARTWLVVPFGALDTLTRREMQALLIRGWEQHRLTVMMITHDIEEAITTSDRVVVMSRRPGSIRAELEVPLERPRHEKMASDPVFRGLFDDILGMVHEPAVLA